MSGMVKCQFCPLMYCRQKHCNRHMKMKHGYNAAAERRKVKEGLFLLKSQQAKIERERKAALKEEARKVKEEAKQKKKEEARKIKEEAKQKKKEEKIVVREEARKVKKEARKRKKEGGEVVSFDFIRDILGGALYCKKCNRAFTTEIERDQHERRHNDPKNFNCSKCYKSFKKMNNKEMHEVHCGGGVSERGVTREEDEEEFSMMSALNGVAKTYQLKFAPDVTNLHPRLTKAMMEASDQLFTIQRSNTNIKYYVSLHCTFYKPTDPDILTVPPVVFNSETSILLPSSNIEDQMKINYHNILQAIENYERNGSGWALYRLERMDINTVRYKLF